MTPKSPPQYRPETPWIKPIYQIILFMLALTGFAQMPIFKRYYIAQIPGLGWLADYYTTHTIHCIGAALLLLIVVYCAVVYLGLTRKRFALNSLAYVKLILLAGIVVTGAFRVLKNLPQFFFSPDFVFLIDLAHLGFALAFIGIGLITLIRCSRWLNLRPV